MFVLASIPALEIFKNQASTVGYGAEWVLLAGVITTFLAVIANQMPALFRENE